MKNILHVSILACAILSAQQTRAQTIDTLIDAGGYKLHFKIIKGTGLPILFEAGGGDTGDVWDKITLAVSTLTGATTIVYDRAGFGKSGFDIQQHGVLNGVKGLETALAKLGYKGNIMLVAHSQGAFPATVYSFRHPGNVKTAVLVDASTACWFNEKRVAVLQASNDQEKKKFQQTKPGLYYQYSDLTSNVAFVRSAPFPTNIPLLDFVSGNPPFTDTTEINDWKDCHREFVNLASNRTPITAYGCGHYIFQDNPPLVIGAIAKMYAGVIDSTQSAEMMRRTADYVMNAVNENKKEEALHRHSETDLNSWGYDFLQKGDLSTALEIFKLNIQLNPSSWNVYDSYGEALLKNGQKKEAVKMYQKSLDINPKNENAKKVIRNLGMEAGGAK